LAAKPNPAAHHHDKRTLLVSMRDEPIQKD